MGVTGVTLDVAIGEVAEGIGVVANGSLMRFKSGTSKLGPPGTEAVGSEGIETAGIVGGVRVGEGTSPIGGRVITGIATGVGSTFFSVAGGAVIPGNAERRMEGGEITLLPNTGTIATDGVGGGSTCGTCTVYWK